MEKMIDVNDMSSGTYTGNYYITGSLRAGSEITLNINGYVILDKLLLNRGILQVNSPFEVTIGDVKYQSGSLIFVESNHISCPRINYQEGVSIAVRGLSLTEWKSLSLSSVRGANITFDKTGEMDIQHFIPKENETQYIKR